MSQEDQDISAAFAEFAAAEDATPVVKPAAATPDDDAAAKAKADADAAAAAAAAAAATPDDDAVAAKAKADADAAAAAAAAAAATPADDSAAAAAAKAEADAAAVAAAAAQAPADDDKYATLLAEIEALKAAQPKPEPAKAAPLYSAEETALVAKYQEDWPDVSKGEALLRRAEYRDLVGYIFEQVEQRYAPVLDYMNSRSGSDQYSDIVALVPDYDAVRDKAIAWVETQPGWLKSTLQKVTSDGSPEEVAGLITMFKKETGYAVPTTPAASAAPAAPAAPAVKALPAAAKKAAVSLSVVKSSRSEQGTAEEDDFDAAFAKYAEAEDKRLAHK